MGDGLQQGAEDEQERGDEDDGLAACGVGEEAGERASDERAERGRAGDEALVESGEGAGEVGWGDGDERRGDDARAVRALAHGAQWTEQTYS